MELLHRVARDLPQYYPCLSCRQLHLWRTVPLPDGRSVVHACPRFRWRPHWLRCQIVGTYSGHFLRFEQFPHCSNYKLDFAHIQLVMRRFYYGPEYSIPVEALRFTEVSTTRIHPVAREIESCLAKELTRGSSSDSSSQKGSDSEEEKPFEGSLMLLSAQERVLHRMTTLISVEGRICSKPPRLCLRIQQLAVVARQNVSKLRPTGSDTWPRLCSHEAENWRSLEDKIFQRPEKNRLRKRKIREAIHGQCDKCSARWKVELRGLPPRKVCLIIT